MALHAVCAVPSLYSKSMSFSPDVDIHYSVENCFYVDNFLQNFTSGPEAKQLVNKLQKLLLSRGFKLHQWATNVPDIISHMPSGSRAESSELWLSPDGADPPEQSLGLLWHCISDTITYQLHHTEHPKPTMQSIYHVLDSTIPSACYLGQNISAASLE